MRLTQKNPSQIGQLKSIVRSAARELAPKITFEGQSGPSVLSVQPWRFSRALNTRLEVEQAATRHARERNNDLGNWSIGSGLYPTGWKYTGEPIGETPLKREEAEIAANLDELLETPADCNPVIALDFGGGLGLSWMRIATQPQYRMAIEEGRLAMVATNLGSTPDQSPDKEGYSGIARRMNRTNKLDEQTDRFSTRYSEKDLAWVQGNQQYVHYLAANALELPAISIDTLAGTTVPLVGNVGLIHESYALTHSHVPDLAMASFSLLLGGRGTLRSDAATHYHLPHPEHFSQVLLGNRKLVQNNDEYFNQRRLGLAIGSRMLQLRGFSYRLDEASCIGVFTRQPNMA